MRTIETIRVAGSVRVCIASEPFNEGYRTGCISASRKTLPFVSSVSLATLIPVLSALTLAGCGGSKTTTTTPPTPQQTAAPVISPNGGNFTTAQTVTVTDSTPNAVLHCTIDGSTPTAASQPCLSVMLQTTGTTTIKVYASAAGYTDSAVSSATFVLTVQTLSWKAASLSVNMPNGKVRIDSTVLNSTCTTLSMAITTQSSNTTVLYSGTLVPTWVPDTTGASTGYLMAPTTLPEDKNPRSSIVASCAGTSVTAPAITLTAAIVAPDAPGVSPSTVKSTSNTVFTLSSPNGTYVARNDNSFTTFVGTAADLLFTASCTTSTGYADTTWVNINSTQQGSASNNAPLGPECYVVHTDSDINGVGGGTAGTPNAVTIVSNVIIGTGDNTFARLDPGTKATVGILHLVGHGQEKTLSVGLGAGSLVFDGQNVYVSNKYSHDVSVVDPSSGSLVGTISLGNHAPILLALSPDHTVYVYAENPEDFTHGAALSLTSNGSFRVISDNVNRATSLTATSNGQLLWTVPGARGEIHGFDLNASSEMPIQYVSPAVDSLEELEDGTILAWQTGENYLLFIAPDTYQEQITTLPSGIWGMSGHYAWLANGQTLSITHTAWNTITILQPSELYGGALFTDIDSDHIQILTTLNGRTKANVIPLHGGRSH